VRGETVIAAAENLHNSGKTGYEQNWLPSPGEDFFVIFRLYGPAKSVYEKTWRMPDIERI
jgi:hypothetical protein